MKKILLLGDSIRMSYRERVAELLDGVATIHTPVENCRYSAYLLWGLGTWAPDDDYDIIQWNNGQWDTCRMLDGEYHTPLPRYLELQQRICTVLQKKTKRLIFATTTPIHGDMFAIDHIHPRGDDDVVTYNRAVTDLLSAQGVEINDLYSLVKPKADDYICDDMVHLTLVGAEACAQQVANLFRA